MRVIAHFITSNFCHLKNVMFSVFEAYSALHVPPYFVGWATCITYSFNSVAYTYVWVRGAKTTGPIAKKFFFSFLNQNFSFGSEKFIKFRHMFCWNKKFCSVKIMFSCTFAVIQIFDNIASLPLISWAISMKFSGYYFFMPIYRCAKFHMGRDSTLYWYEFSNARKSVWWGGTFTHREKITLSHMK
jgi:hypothetical protein